MIIRLNSQIVNQYYFVLFNDLFHSKLLTNPIILFCDEPTTGLDSFSAQKLVHLMDKMACQGKTIVCTIHQPSSELFAMFNQLILVADGRIVFNGTATSAIEFFKRLVLLYYLF